jgi:transketolase
VPTSVEYPGNHVVEVGHGWTARDGRDAVVFAYGPWLLSNAWEAVDAIEKATGASLKLVCLPWLNRVDPVWLLHAIGHRRVAVTIDNHYLHGGQGEMIAAAIASLGLDPIVRVTRIGVTELPECGTNDEVLAYHGLDVAGLVARLHTALDVPTPGGVPQVA